MIDSTWLGTLGDILAMTGEFIEGYIEVGCSCTRFTHCCVFSWWCHQMETFSASLDICAGNSPVHGEFPAKRPVTRSSDVFFDLRLQINGWLYNREAGDLRRHRAHYDVIVMYDLVTGNAAS